MRELVLLGAFSQRSFCYTLVRFASPANTAPRASERERAMLADASASTGAIICAPLISAAPSSAEAGAGASPLGFRAGSAHDAGGGGERRWTGSTSE